MILKKNNLCVKILSIFLSFSILFLSPYAKYIDSTCIDKVHATSVAVAEAGTVCVEWIVAYFASLGLGAVAYENKEALAEAYFNTQSLHIDEYGMNNVNEITMQLYDYTSNSIKNISWDDLKTNLQTDYNLAVDGLTDVYVKVCPQLLWTFEDFVTSVINGDTYVDGISDAIIDYSPVTTSDIEEQWSGHGYTFNFTGTTPFFHGSHTGTATYEHTRDLFSPCAGYITHEDSYGNKTFQFIYDNGNIGNPTKVTCSCGYTRTDVGNWALESRTYSCNVPIFNSSEAVYNYIETGKGYENALNYGLSWDDTITDNNDLPPFYKTWQQQLWEQIANAPDVGIGSYGGALVNDWATDLPFIGLGALEDYITSVQDVFEKTIDDIIDGVYDPTLDIPTTYDKAWEDAIDRTWEDVIEDSKEKTQENEKENTGEKEDEKTDEKEEIHDPPSEEIKSGPFVADLSKFFPFCIPFDLIHLFSVLEAEPETPRWEIPFKIPAYGVDETIVIDLSAFDGVAKIVRLCETILFIFSLILATRGLIKG